MTPVTAADWAEHRRAAVQAFPVELAGRTLPDVLLPYQQELLAATATTALTVTDKSRRIGATWGVGADAVLTSGADKAAGGMDTSISATTSTWRASSSTSAPCGRGPSRRPARRSSEFLFTEEDGTGARSRDRRLPHHLRLRPRDRRAVVAAALAARPPGLRHPRRVRLPRRRGRPAQGGDGAAHLGRQGAGHLDPQRRGQSRSTS